ncbi:MAG TPA: ELWxxDGT repeat protein, partial [Herpetosiphonaceae bacterium]
MSPTIRHLRPRHLLRLIGCALLLFAGTGRGAAQGQPSQLLLKDIAPGAASADPRLLTTVGDRVFFTAAAPDTGRELWTSDGTEAGTRLVADLTPGPDSSAINVMAAFDGRLLFLLQTAGGFELRASDGAGTTLIASAEGQYPDRGFAVSAGAVYFSTQTFPGIGGTHRLWRSDGSTAGTASLAQV